jgi:hypothetical protein
MPASESFALPSANDGPDAPASPSRIEAASLLLIQADSEPPPRRRRRAAPEVAQDALDLLAALQRALLGGATPDPAALAALADEAETLGGGADGLCRSVALRIRIEIAKMKAGA